MAKWIEFTGSDGQIEEIQKSEHGWMTEDLIIIDGSAPIYDLISIGNKYLICEPHPYADIIKIWADTGCEVYVRITSTGTKDEFPELAEYIESVEHTETYVTDKPKWNIPGAEYRLTPFEE